MLKSSKYYDIGLWIIFGFSMGLSIYSTWCGLRLTYDSYDYLAAAKSFREGCILINRDGLLYIFHAPFFPVLLSFIGEYPMNFLLIVNKIICLLTLLLLFISTKKLFNSKILYLLCLATISVNVGFQMSYNFLWTEPLFLLLFVAHNYLLLRFLERKNKLEFMLLVCFAFFMGITKNTGFFIILITSGILMFFTEKDAFKKAVIYGVLGSIGFAAWNTYVLAYRNGLQMFRNNEFLTGFEINLFNYADILSQWFLPGFIPTPFRLFFIFFLGVILLVILKKDSLTIQVKIFMIQFLAYVLIMIVAVKVDADEIERLLSIVAPWFIIATYLIIDLKWGNISYAYRISIIIVLIMWVTYIGSRSVYNSIRWHNENCMSENLTKYDYAAR